MHDKGFPAVAEIQWPLSNTPRLGPAPAGSTGSAVGLARVDVEPIKGTARPGPRDSATSAAMRCRVGSKSSLRQQGARRLRPRLCEIVHEKIRRVSTVVYAQSHNGLPSGGSRSSLGTLIPLDGDVEAGRKSKGWRIGSSALDLRYVYCQRLDEAISGMPRERHGPATRRPAPASPQALGGPGPERERAQRAFRGSKRFLG